MTINANIDLGQILIGVLISTVGWFIKHELSNINTRLDKHDAAILDLIRQVSIIIGRRRQTDFTGFSGEEG